MVPTGVTKTFPPALSLSAQASRLARELKVFHSFVTISLSKSKENVKLYYMK